VDVSSLHTSVGFAVVGAVVGEYLGSAAGLGYLIQQAEGVFDVAGVFAGMFVLSAFVILIDYRRDAGRATAAGVAARGGGAGWRFVGWASAACPICRSDMWWRTASCSPASLLLQAIDSIVIRLPRAKRAW
jgi:hypothetical protein